jgi:hypothetical protein
MRRAATHFTRPKQHVCFAVMGPTRLSRPRLRASSGALLVLLACALAMPALASAARVPNCARFSRARMAQLIGSGSLTFEGRNSLANICEYKSPRIPGGYADLLAVSVRATSRRVFNVAKSQLSFHGPPGAITHTIRIPGAIGFYVNSIVIGAGPCRSPGAALPELGPPLCEGQPEQSAISVYAYGALKPRGPKVFVSVGLTGTYGDVFSAPLIAITKAILSRRIH